MKVEASFAAQLYDNVRKIAPETPGGTDPDAVGFAEAMRAAGAGLVADVEAGERAMMGAMSGEQDVQAVVEALTATELALETAVTVRNRVVEAYQELLRMPV